MIYWSFRHLEKESRGFGYDNRWQEILSRKTSPHTGGESFMCSLLWPCEEVSFLLQQCHLGLLSFSVITERHNINWLLTLLMFCRRKSWSLSGGQRLGVWSLTWRIVLKWCWMMFVPRVYSRKRPYILQDTPLSPWVALLDTPPSLPATHLSERIPSTPTQRERLPKW